MMILMAMILMAMMMMMVKDVLISIRNNTIYQSNANNSIE